MATRGAIGIWEDRNTMKFSAVYHHWDSYPSGLGETLWKSYNDYFSGNLGAMVEYLLSEKVGWSSINGDLRLPALWVEGSGWSKEAALRVFEPNFKRLLNALERYQSGALVIKYDPKAPAEWVTKVIKIIGIDPDTDQVIEEKAFQSTDPLFPLLFYIMDNAPKSYSQRGEKPSDPNGDRYHDFDGLNQSNCEYVYLFDLDAYTMDIIDVTSADGVGLLAVINLRDTVEPNWANIEESKAVPIELAYALPDGNEDDSEMPTTVTSIVVSKPDTK